MTQNTTHTENNKNNQNITEKKTQENTQKENNTTEETENTNNTEKKTIHISETRLSMNTPIDVVQLDLEQILIQNENDELIPLQHEKKQ